MIFNKNTAALFSFLLASFVSTGMANHCYWDIDCLKGSGYCCSETWHTLEDKKENENRFLKGRALEEEKSNDFSGIPQYLDDRLAEGAIDQEEYDYMTSFYLGLKVCRGYERGTAVTPADDGERNLGSHCFWDIDCISGKGYCCSETWHTLEDGSQDRYLAQAISGQDETFIYTKTNTFYGIPKYLRDRLRDGDISQDEFILLQAYYDGLRLCREHERSN